MPIEDAAWLDATHARPFPQKFSGVDVLIRDNTGRFRTADHAARTGYAQATRSPVPCASEPQFYWSSGAPESSVFGSSGRCPGAMRPKLHARGSCPSAPARRRAARLWRAFAGLVILLGLLHVPRPSNARLHAYFVLQSNNTGSSSPRIVFVLDSSGSMAVRADDTYTRCTWSECEDADDYRQSRISAARKAINAVVTHQNRRARVRLAV